MSQNPYWHLVFKYSSCSWLNGWNSCSSSVFEWIPQCSISCIYLLVDWPPPTLQSKHVGFWPLRLLPVQTYTQTQTAAAQTLELKSNMIQHPWLNASFSKNSSCPLPSVPSTLSQVIASIACTAKWGLTFKVQPKTTLKQHFVLVLRPKIGCLFLEVPIKHGHLEAYSRGPGVTLKWFVSQAENV